MREDIVDRAVSSIQSDTPDAAAADAALRRVGEKLAAPAAAPEVTAAGSGVLRSCNDFVALVPAHLEGRLTPALELLFTDHTRSCVRCRKAIKAAKAGQPPAAAAAEPAARRWGASRLALAASLLVAAALGAAWYLRGPLAGPAARLDVADGPVLAPELGTVVPAGAVVDAGRVVRTTRGGGAVLVLADGSRVELAARSEVSITRSRAGTTVALARGRVIVQAAKQRNGHLFVRTGDCLVSVTGTVFSVARGAKGTRVSVLEGEVHVDDGKAETVLRRGDQASTQGASARVALEDDFAWSRNRGAFLELAGELARLRKEMAATPASWSGRTSTRLLDAMPDGTVLYAAVPNVAGNVADLYEKLAPRLETNPVLASWWNAGPGAPERKAEIERMLAALRTWGSYFGDEVALGVGTAPDGRPGAPLVLTTTVKPGFRAFLEGEIAKVSGADAKVKIVDDAAAAAAAGKGTLLVFLRDDLVAAAFDGATLVKLEAALAGTASGFRSGTFHARLADAYRDGIDLLAGADVKGLLAKTAAEAAADPRTATTLEKTGLLDVEHLVVERRSSGEASSGRATLTFDAPRRGLAAWVASPAPMGALTFVSSGAAAAVAVVTREPALLVDDLFAVFASGKPTFPEELARFEAEHGIRFRDDLAASLGGDLALAVDGPLLPTPSWKLVVEVYDPGRLEAAFEKLVALAGSAARKAGKEAPQLVTETVDGRVFHVLVSPDGARRLQYTFVDGYLVAAPERALLLRAIETRRTGDTLLTAQKLTALMPKDGPLDFSLLAYQDVGGTLGALASAAGVAQGSAASGLASAGASLAWGWAEPSRIVLGSAGTGLGDLSALLGGGALLSSAGHAPAAQGR